MRLGNNVELRPRVLMGTGRSRRAIVRVRCFTVTPRSGARLTPRSPCGYLSMPGKVHGV